MTHSIHFQKDTDTDKSDQLGKIGTEKTEQESCILNHSNRMCTIIGKMLVVRKYKISSGE